MTTLTLGDNTLLSLTGGYRARAMRAAAFEREACWSEAAAAWVVALEVATGLNYHWVRCRHEWCLSQASRPLERR